jgi:hypothetical protein
MLKGSQIIYKGTYWYAGTADSGVHTNSGVFKSLVLHFIYRKLVQNDGSVLM